MSSADSDDQVRFLADENFEPAIVTGLRRREPRIDIVTAVEAGILGLKDPELLAYAAQQDRILVSHDKRTLPGHFAEFLIAGLRSPGIMLLSPNLSIGQSIEALLLIWAASRHSEWCDRITRLPL
ncbi:MAG: hypothetical protein OJF49_003310 [Ktedonobacterales bacterium]|jgi:predicted nuclease of predicted toxin-antitoxin system|nr:MAG: hypothetical protein OJF49_003310 [Ktedonobacterales bacterium]